MRRLGAVALLVVAGCSVDTGGADHFTLSEWAIEGPSRMVAADAMSLTVENQGEFRHTLVVTSETGEVVGATGVVEPGDMVSLAVDLGAGTYSFSCRIVTEDDKGNLSDHYERGMYRTVAVESG
ncbi:MAG TPA: hypothetical protein VF083_12165 [Acidimicrobiia bacterium]